MPDKRGKIHSSMEIEIQFINVIKDKQMVIHKERQMGLRGQFDQHQMRQEGQLTQERKKTNSLSRKISKHQAKGKKSTRPKANGKRPGKPLPAVKLLTQELKKAIGNYFE